MSLITFLLGLLLTAERTHNLLPPERILQERTTLNPRPLPAIYSRPGKGGNRRSYYGKELVDSVIKSDFVCNDDSIGGCKHIVPDVAIGANGKFIVTWCDFRDGDADVWFQRFNVAGQRIGVNERINTDVTLGWQGDPAVTTGPDGGWTFSWEDRREIGNSDVFAQRFESTGNRLGDNFRVSDSGVSGDQSVSAIHTVPDGTTIITWDDRRYGLTGDIFAQLYNPDGSKRGSNFRVNDDPIGLGNQYEPDVSGDDSNRFVVVWMDGRRGNWDIFLQRFDADGNRLGNNVLVTPDDSIQWTPQVACAPAGWFVVTWDDRRGMNWDVYAQIYSATAAPIGTNFQVNTDAGGTDQYGNACAVNNFGEFIVVWTDKRNGNEDIYAQRFDTSGSRIGIEFKVNDDIGSAAQNSPAVVAAQDGGYWIFWSDARNGNFDIYGQYVARDGVPRGANFRVNDDYASSHQRCSSIGMERKGNIVIAWEDERGVSCDIYRTVLDSSGNELTSNLRVNDDAGGAAQYYPSVAGGNQKFIVAWFDNRVDGDIYAQFLDFSGQKLGGNFRVNSDVGNNFQWYPYCAMDSSNRAVVVWMDYRDRQYRIYARRYDESGNPVGEEFPIADTVAEGAYASVAMNSNGYWVVSWMDNRDGDYNIYCQLFRNDGSKIGKNIRVNTDPGRVYQGYPSCAIAEDRTIAIAWEDTRNGDYDVYLQWLDSLGNLLEDNERVNDDPGGNDCYSPSCAFDQLGRLVVLFNDEREVTGNPQIYCQRFRADRTRIGTNAKVNEPNYFPKNTHWTVGQSVAANSSIIAWTWTDNRRHLGWDIYAKLTDWNVIGLEEKCSNNQVLNASRIYLPSIIANQKQFTIELPSNVEVQIYDAAGRQYECSRTVTGQVPLDFNKFNPGVYFLMLRQEKEAAVRKLIVQ
ncbi:MAG: T9SS type A sorting domain-containing protein [candidate division WOR-3 bacterium]|jgi:hypothetical protein|nr:T9SS type A sorting domain-containing protein [candidate division WOR-3 bacterium]MDH7518661.1 T9SS type A sorting domain-containing protein [bacterium]